MNEQPVMQAVRLESGRLLALTARGWVEYPGLLEAHDDWPEMFIDVGEIAQFDG